IKPTLVPSATFNDIVLSFITPPRKCRSNPALRCAANPVIAPDHDDVAHHNRIERSLLSGGTVRGGPLCMSDPPVRIAVLRPGERVCPSVRLCSAAEVTGQRVVA